MPRQAKVMELALTDEARSTLSVLARSRTAPAHHIERSAIILHLADRRSTSETALALGIDRQRVTRCARRLAAVGPLKAINDLPRSGRRPDITEAARTWLIGEACAKPKDRGYPHELWTLRLLAAHARCYGPLAGHPCLAELAPSTVHDILNNQPLKPHKVRYYLDRRDPVFDERKAKVIEVYAAAEMLRRLRGRRADLRSAR
jgi:Winged helix-turn helix